MTQTKKPWHFTIVFDENKAKKHGYNTEELYDCVGMLVEPYGNVRTARGSWRAKDTSLNHAAQPAALCRLCETKWVMQNIKSWTVFEDSNEPDGSDYLQILKRHRPYLLCAE